MTDGKTWHAAQAYPEETGFAGGGFVCNIGGPWPMQVKRRTRDECQAEADRRAEYLNALEARAALVDDAVRALEAVLIETSGSKDLRGTVTWLREHARETLNRFHAAQEAKG